MVQQANILPLRPLGQTQHQAEGLQELLLSFFFSLVCVYVWLCVFLNVHCVFTSVLPHSCTCVFSYQHIILQIVVRFEIIHFAGLITVINLALDIYLFIYCHFHLFSISYQLCNTLQPKHSKGMKHTPLVLEKRRHHRVS